MKYDLILVGPMGSGKTTFTKVLVDGKTPKIYVSTISNGDSTKYDPGWFKKNLFVLDAGGAVTEVNQYEEWFKESKKIAFVFNGVKLLEEVKGCENGGYITSLCRKICKIYENNNLRVPLYFIATYKDEYLGDKNLFCDNIIESIRVANERYKEMTSNHSQRYTFYKYMPGKLFSLGKTCIKKPSIFSTKENVECEISRQDVIEIFNTIIKEN